MVYRLVEMDVIDRRLVKLLQQNARQSSESLSKRLNLSSGCIRRRIRRLIAEGSLRIVATVNPDSFGLLVTAIVAIRSDKRRLDHIFSSLRAHRGVKWICTTTGQYDIFMAVRYHSAEELSHFLQTAVLTTDGVESCETFVCLSKHGNLVWREDEDGVQGASADELMVKSTPRRSRS